jgi:ATP-dependent helicase YprA (DUF1998 family)
MIPNPQTFKPTILSIINSECNNHMVPAPPGFPFEMAYEGQVDAVKRIQASDKSLVCSHTGSGKTAVFLAALPGFASLVIEPRK